MLTFKYLNSVWVSQPSLSEPCLFALSILIRTTHSVHVSNREWAWLWCFYRLWFYVFVNGEKVCWVNAMSNRPIIWSINDWLGFNKTAPHLSVMRVYCPLWTLEINNSLFKSMSVLLHCFLFVYIFFSNFGLEYRKAFFYHSLIWQTAAVLRLYYDCSVVEYRKH